MGATILVACAVMAVALAVPGQTDTPGNSGTIYNPSRWALLAALVAAGVVLAVRKDAADVRVASAVGAVAAGQLVTTGLFAFRRWVSVAGSTGIGLGNRSTVRGLALVLAAAGLVALTGCVAAWAAATVRPRLAAYDAVPALLVAVVLAAGLPWVLGAGRAETTDATSLVGYALLHSVPWGAAVLVSGWLRRPVALACLATTVGSALVCLLTRTPFDRVAHPVLGFGLAALAGAYVLVRRLDRSQP